MATEAATTVVNKAAGRLASNGSPLQLVWFRVTPELLSLSMPNRAPISWSSVPMGERV
jgi:hypothetical protein